MALLTSELTRIKAELGFPLLSNSAEPHVGIVALFEQVIQPYMLAGVATTSSTTVAAATTATPATLSLASATSITSGDRLVIDVDDRQEVATIQNLSGTDATLLLKKAHSGTYPVTVEGGETIVRETLLRIAEVKKKLEANYGAGALKTVDEVEFYEAEGKTYFGTLGENLHFWRQQLAAHLGLSDRWNATSGTGGGALSVY